jgi:hypothetical protein
LESGCNPDIKNKVSHTIRPNPGRPPKSKNRQNPAESGDSSKFRGELRGAPKTKIPEKSGESSKDKKRPYPAESGQIRGFLQNPGRGRIQIQKSGENPGRPPKDKIPAKFGRIRTNPGIHPKSRGPGGGLQRQKSGKNPGRPPKDKIPAKSGRIWPHPRIPPKSGGPAGRRALKKKSTFMAVYL